MYVCVCVCVCVCGWVREIYMYDVDISILVFSIIVNEGFGSLFNFFKGISEKRTKTKKNHLKIYHRVDFFKK